MSVLSVISSSSNAVS